MSNLKRFIEKTRIDDAREQAIKSAMAQNGFRTRADAIRWLLAKGAMFTGNWPDSAYLNVPPRRANRLVDPGVEYKCIVSSPDDARYVFDTDGREDG